MTDTKENKVNGTNANAKTEDNAKAKKTHSKIDLKNMFKSKHNSKKESAIKDKEGAKADANEEKKEEPKAENQKNDGNNNDTIDCEGDAKKPLDDCEGCKDEVLGETDKAVGKPITGFSEKVGASFRKWFHLAGASQ